MTTTSHISFSIRIFLLRFHRQLSAAAQTTTFLCESWCSCWFYYWAIRGSGHARFDVTKFLFFFSAFSIPNKMKNDALRSRRLLNVLISFYGFCVSQSAKEPERERERQQWEDNRIQFWILYDNESPRDGFVDAVLVVYGFVYMTTSTMITSHRIGVGVVNKILPKLNTVKQVYVRPLSFYLSGARVKLIKSLNTCTNNVRLIGLCWRARTTT